jgi:hypothetical protein
VSTSSSAGCSAASTAARMAGMSLVTPVEVSLWTTISALIDRSRSAARRSWTRSGSTPCRQLPGTSSTSRPRARAIWAQRPAKWPLSNASTRSPGERVLTRAASQAPVPDDGKATTGPVVPKIGLRPSRTARASEASSGPRWSIVGAASARRIRSGTLVGPGIWRKWRPLR